MAVEELDEEVNEEGTAKAGGKKSKLLLILVVVLLIALTGGGTAYYFMKGAAPLDAVADAESDDGDVNAEDVEEAPATAYYFSLNPPFVVNFVGKSRAKFLQVSISGLTRDPSVKENITTHLPHIRNNIVFILSSKRHEDLITPEGKEELRKQILGEIRSILKKETGKDDVEDIYFTSFVMQ